MPKMCLLRKITYGEFSEFVRGKKIIYNLPLPCTIYGNGVINDTLEMLNLFLNVILTHPILFTISFLFFQNLPHVVNLNNLPIQPWQPLISMWVQELNMLVTTVIFWLDPPKGAVCLLDFIRNFPQYVDVSVV